ncbi:hypothetical protein AWB92_00350 [Mycobacterium sp. IEC1808]|uniref:DUF732 domain-containing protein n=1 Tax=Mycobacterium sp. IEC1808 TaxID=1743230 RepID=UPI000A158269|nr:DUF732 domain-containing protein [Mycobacterium sp. IEC1808]ORW91998.1 hypothetical protein AWB92_00350 [Mycobacterium sp. IEC1808]
MFAFRIAAAVATALVGAAVGLAVATAGVASAGTVDDAFITDIRGAGIGIDSPQAAIMDGYLVCVELNAGSSGPEIARQVLSETNLTTKQADYFVVVAAKAYCPQFAK